MSEPESIVLEQLRRIRDVIDSQRSEVRQGFAKADVEFAGLRDREQSRQFDYNRLDRSDRSQSEPIAELEARVEHLEAESRAH